MKNRPFRFRLGYALAGIRAAWQLERSFRTQVLCAIGACLYLILLRPDLIWWALIGIMVALVLGAELMNTALEQLADRLHPERHRSIQIAKDCAAGAVLLLSVAAVLTAILAAWDTLA